MANYNEFEVITHYIIADPWNTIKEYNFNKGSATTDIPPLAVLRWDSSNNRYVPATTTDTINENTDIAFTITKVPQTATTAKVLIRGRINGKKIKIWNTATNSFVDANLNIDKHPRFKLV